MYYKPSAALGDVIGVAQTTFVNKECHCGYFMSQNVQYMKVNIVNINAKAVATFLLTKIICDNSNKVLDPPLKYIQQCYYLKY